MHRSIGRNSEAVILLCLTKSDFKQETSRIKLFLFHGYLEFTIVIILISHCKHVQADSKVKEIL